MRRYGKILVLRGFGVVIMGAKIPLEIRETCGETIKKPKLLGEPDHSKHVLFSSFPFTCTYIGAYRRNRSNKKKICSTVDG